MGYGDFEDNGHDGLPSMYIPPLSFPGPIDVSGLELPPIESYTSLEPWQPPASPPSTSPEGEQNRSATPNSTRTSSESHIATPPSEASRPDDSSASEPTDAYMVIPAAHTGEARSSAAFLRILSLVPLRNIVHECALPDYILYWNIVMTKDQALELHADPSIGAVIVPDDLHYGT